METAIQAARDDRGPTNGDAPLLLTAEQVAGSLAVCRTKVYELLRNGELESVRIGSSRRIPADALAQYVEQLRGGARGSSDSWPEWPTVVRQQHGS